MMLNISCHNLFMAICQINLPYPLFSYIDRISSPTTPFHFMNSASVSPVRRLHTQVCVSALARRPISPSRHKALGYPLTFNRLIISPTASVRSNPARRCFAKNILYFVIVTPTLLQRLELRRNSLRGRLLGMPSLTDTMSQL